MEIKITQAENKALLYATYLTLYINDLAINAIQELEPYMKDAHKESQKIYGALRKKTNEYKTMIKNIMGEYQILQSLFYDEMDKQYEPLTENLYDAIFDAVEPHLKDNAPMIAKSEYARVMCDLATLIFDGLVSSCKQYSNKVNRLAYLRITKIQENCTSLGDWIVFLFRNEITINLNECQDIVNAVRAIDEETTNYEAFERAISIAHKEPIKPKGVIKKRVMVKLGNDSKEFYDSIADCARFFKVSTTTIKNYAESGKKFKGVFTIKIVE
jgi:6-pyruvoyl-tetrahydropterin synthase